MHGNRWLGVLDDCADTVATPFEQWCDRQGVHPEAPLVWESYEASLRHRLPVSP